MVTLSPSDRKIFFVAAHSLHSSMQRALRRRFNRATNSPSRFFNTARSRARSLHTSKIRIRRRNFRLVCRTAAARAFIRPSFTARPHAFHALRSTPVRERWSARVCRERSRHRSKNLRVRYLCRIRSSCGGISAGVEVEGGSGVSVSLIGLCGDVKETMGGVASGVEGMGARVRGGGGDGRRASGEMASGLNSGALSAAFHAAMRPGWYFGTLGLTTGMNDVPMTWKSGPGESARSSVCR